MPRLRIFSDRPPTARFSRRSRSPNQSHRPKNARKPRCCAATLRTPAGAADAARAPVQWIPASSEETLRELSFDELSESERTAVLRLIARLRTAVETRPSRRRRAEPHGDRFDFRGTLRGAARTAGELIRRRATARRDRVRPLVFLIDVSGSMTPFARALLQYARATALAGRACAPLRLRPG